MIMPLAQIIMADAAGPKRMGRVMGLVAVPMMLAPTLGPLLGGAIIQALNWHWIFYVNIVVGAIAVPLSVRILLPRTLGSSAPTRWTSLGLALMSTGLVGRHLRNLAEAGTYHSFGNVARLGADDSAGIAPDHRPSCSTRCARQESVARPERLYRRWHFSAASIVMFALGARRCSAR